MKTNKTIVWGFFAVLFALAFIACPDDPDPIRLKFTLINNDTEYSVSGEGMSGAVIIPATYNGKPVTRIESWAFSECTRLTSITIPASVTSICGYAFSNWTSSQTIYVRGYASEAAADAAWDTEWPDGSWRRYCNATIKYWNGSEYQ